MLKNLLVGRGKPKCEKPSNEAERIRKLRTNAKLRVHTAEELAAAANKGSQFQNVGMDKIKRGSVTVAERITRRAMADLAPKGGMLTKEVMLEAQAMSREALLLMARSIPELTATVIRRANEGDATCLSIVARWLPNPADCLSLNLPAGMTTEEAAGYLAGAGLSGDMSVKEATAGLRLLELHGNVDLNAALTARLAALRKQLEKVSQVSSGSLSGRKLPSPTIRLLEDGELESIELTDAQDIPNAHN
jgi:hypothetical protein